MYGRNEKYIGFKKFLGATVIICGGFWLLNTLGLIFSLLTGYQSFDEWFNEPFWSDASMEMESPMSFVTWRILFWSTIIASVLIKILGGKLTNINLSGYDNCSDKLDEYYKAIYAKINSLYKKKFIELKTQVDTNQISEQQYNFKLDTLKSWQKSDINNAKPKRLLIDKCDDPFFRCPLYYRAFNDEKLKGFHCEAF